MFNGHLDIYYIMQSAASFLNQEKYVAKLLATCGVACLIYDLLTFTTMFIR